MADVFDPAKRSWIMSRVGSKNTTPELTVRKYLHARGFRYRLHDKHLPGKPDIILPKYKTIVFVQGCFWHGHQGCPKFALPKTRTEFWDDKIRNNIARDERSRAELKDKGWRVIDVWQCELKPAKISSTLERMAAQIIAYV